MAFRANFGTSCHLPGVKGGTGWSNAFSDTLQLRHLNYWLIDYHRAACGESWG